MDNSRVSFDSDEYVIIRKCVVSANKPVPYPTFRESFKSFPTLYRIYLNSVQTLPDQVVPLLTANSLVSDSNLQRYGRWASLAAENTQVKKKLYFAGTEQRAGGGFEVQNA